MAGNAGNYEKKEFSKSRRNISLLLEYGFRKHTIHSMLEFDVTEARRMIHAEKEKTGRRVSFTGWVIKCVGQAMADNKELNAYRLGRRKIVVFDDVDISIPVERVTNEGANTVAYIIRKANEKSVTDITDEIRSVQRENVDASTQLLGELNFTERLIMGAPLFIQKLMLRYFSRNGLLMKKYMGTVGVSSVGTLGKFPGWVIPLGTPAVMILVGGITKKPAVIDNKIEIRECLHITVTVDHDMVDGGPMVRFVDRLNELMEGAFGLEE
ncbi:MAG: 2-oxo acid dehydrogenase subunit E2 [Thermoplasmata archaeon]|nr:2-oxo acid dehydrogenase subunit E2 [Thermoplasmata archaeon]